MNLQVVGIEASLKPVPNVTGGFKVPSRKTSALRVAACFQQGKWVQERILRHEKLWIQHHKIPVSNQGKNTKMMVMLEDEGTMNIVQECIAGAGASRYPN